MKLTNFFLSYMIGLILQMDSDVFHRDSKLTLVPIPQSEQQQQQQQDDTLQSDIPVFDEKYKFMCLCI